MVDRSHPDVGDSLTLAEYQALGHVQFRNSGRPTFETWFARTHGDERRVEVLAASFGLLPQLVAGTRRVATLHARQALLACAGLPVRSVRLAFETPLFTESLQWHKYRDLDPGSLWLRELFIARARPMPPLAAA